MKAVLLAVLLVFATEVKARSPFKTCQGLPRCLCSDSVLMAMTCDGIELTSVPVSKVSNNVTYLALSDNLLGSIPVDAFSSYSQVRAMYLSNSGIRSIHKDAFRKVPTLKELDLSFNPLKELHPDTFAGNPVLQTLVLMANEFLHLPEGPVLASSSLTKLDLSYCGIGALSPDAFSKLPNLRHLDLASNRLATLAASTLRPMPVLEELRLEGNEWRCDCGLHELLGWTDTLHGRPPHYRATTCVADNGEDEMLWSLDEQGQQCASPDGGLATRRTSTEVSRTRLEVVMQKTLKKTVINSKSGLVLVNGKDSSQKRLLEPTVETKNTTLNVLKLDRTPNDKDVQEGKGKDEAVTKETQTVGNQTSHKISQWPDNIQQPNIAHLEKQTAVNSELKAIVSKDRNFENMEQEDNCNEQPTLSISSTTFEIIFIIVLVCISIAIIVLTGLLIMYALSEGRNVYSLIRSDSQVSRDKGPNT